MEMCIPLRFFQFASEEIALKFQDALQAAKALLDTGHGIPGTLLGAILDVVVCGEV